MEEIEVTEGAILKGTDYLLYSYGFVSNNEPERYEISLSKVLLSELLMADFTNANTRLEMHDHFIM